MGQEILQQLIYRHSWRLFINMSLRSASFIDEAFSAKKQKFQSWVYSPQVSIRISKL